MTFYLSLEALSLYLQKQAHHEGSSCTSIFHVNVAELLNVPGQTLETQCYGAGHHLPGVGRMRLAVCTQHFLPSTFRQFCWKAQHKAHPYTR